MKSTFHRLAYSTTLKSDFRDRASYASSLSVAYSDSGNWRRSCSSCRREGAMTMSMSFVDRGMPCAELANEPVTKYRMPAVSSAARNFSKTGPTLNVLSRSHRRYEERSAQSLAPNTPDGDVGCLPSRWREPRRSSRRRSVRDPTGRLPGRAAAESLRREESCRGLALEDDNTVCLCGRWGTAGDDTGGPTPSSSYRSLSDTATGIHAARDCRATSRRGRRAAE